MFACNGILFNHESPMRSTGFVTRKITEALSKIVFGQLDTLRMGNLDAERDWDTPKITGNAMVNDAATGSSDYVIATGRNHTVREFILEATKTLEFKLNGLAADKRNKGLLLPSTLICFSVKLISNSTIAQ